MVDKLIEVIKLMLNSVYKEYGVKYDTNIKGIWYDITGYGIGLVIKPNEKRGQTRAYYIDMALYTPHQDGSPDDEVGRSILNIYIGKKSVAKHLPNPVNLFEKIFSTPYVNIKKLGEHSYLYIPDYTESTDVMDIVMNSTPEELELYLKMLL